MKLDFHFSFSLRLIAFLLWEAHFSSSIREFPEPIPKDTNYKGKSYIFCIWENKTSAKAPTADVT